MRFLLFLLIAFPIFGSDFYEQTLERAYNAFQEKKYSKAIEKLDIILSKENNKDWRYYSIRAEIHEALNQEDEAIEHYTFSIALNPAQPNVFRKLYELNFKIKRPSKSFDFIRLYLSKNDKDIEMRYRALILSKRIGNNEYSRFALKKIYSENQFNSEKNNILENIYNLILKKKFTLAKIECKKYLPYFPEEESLHNYIQISQKNIDPKGKEMESILMDTAVIFADNSKYTNRLAFFYKENNQYYPALNLFRRVFYNSLAREGFSLDTESILFLKECYFQLGQSGDVRAMLALLEIFGENKNLDLDSLNSLRINFNNNREILMTILYFTKQNKLTDDFKKFREILTERDEKKSDLEFMNIYSVFIYDDFRNTVE